LGNESQFGGVANILFTGTLMPEVFLVGISLRSTRELANSWGQIVGIGNDIVLVDVMFSADLEAGFIGLFDGNAALTVRTSNSWRSVKPVPEARMLVAGGQLPLKLLEPGDYSVSVDGDMDVYELDLVTGLSGFALVIVAKKVTQIDEGHVDQPTPTSTPTPAPATAVTATQPADDGREPDIIPQPTTADPGGSTKTVVGVLATVVAAMALAIVFGRRLRRWARD
jgi:hypothetical protein